MRTITYDDVRRQAEQLSLDERAALLEYLQETLNRQWSQISQQRQQEMIRKLGAQMAKFLENTSEESAMDWLTQSPETISAVRHFMSLVTSFVSLGSSRVTRETLLAELGQLRAEGAFEDVESLRNKYADPPLELSDDELRASISEFSQAWEQDLDDLLDDN